jgi:dihydropteroate synthase
MFFRLLELQNESDAATACRAVRRGVDDTNLRGWAAVVLGDPVQLGTWFRERAHRARALFAAGQGGGLLCGDLGALWQLARAAEDELQGEGARLAGSLRAAVEALDAPPPALRLRDRELAFDRTRIMGVVNVTPDSFSDGGRYYDTHTAVEHGLQLAAEGADLLDVGGESTRPGAAPVSTEEELRRVLPAIERLAREAPVPVSVDTSRAAVARPCLQAGARMVNDVTGLRGDPEMAAAAAQSGAALCLMHMQGEPRTMQEAPRYGDLLGEVQGFLARACERAREAGVEARALCVDPGIGFGKTAGHNLYLLRHLRSFKALGYPVLVGTSRKSFIGNVSGAPVDDRLPGTLASITAAALAGAAIVRVHDVAEARQALAIADAIRAAGEAGDIFSMRT